ncbi:unnamed protein product [Blepharisma stoltei]|uniref:C2 domain-containing protein n=1 Tax=Blepharisma stoltei TaxID=1481888 RepID=A0AAU9JHG2_9CILI|nr:unnamed protein product [Blepharisma stoltei]
MLISKNSRTSIHIAQVELFITCRDLEDLHTFGKSHPLAELFIKHSSDGEWIKHGQTEMIDDTQNPEFLTSFVLSFSFEEQTYIKIKINDIHHSRHGHPEIHDDDLIGIFECNLGQLVASPGKQVMKDLVRDHHNHHRHDNLGAIILRVEEIKENNDHVTIQFACEKLDDVSSTFGHLTPLFYLGKHMSNGAVQKFYKSEVRNRNGEWKPVEKTIHEYCNGDLHRELLLEVYDYHRSGNHKFIGSATFALYNILHRQTQELILLNPHGNSHKSHGKIIIEKFQRIKIPSFLEYIAGGLKISLNIAIDFTSSNGDPRNPNSLHYSDPYGYNHYESALFGISEILLNYDSDQLIPIYGFGGEIDGEVNHCFPLTFDAGNPSVQGLDGIMNAYKNALSQIVLSGPTLFGPIVSEIVMEAERIYETQTCQRYDVLLILTDGDPYDMQETIDWIVRGSFCPLSIIIVGIGSEYFENVAILGTDDKEPLIDSDGRQEERDIVKFIHYREVDHSPAALCQEILSKLPGEVVKYFSKRGILPNRPEIVSPASSSHHLKNHHLYKVDK